MEIVGAEADVIGEMARQWLRSSPAMRTSPLKLKVRADSRRLLQKKMALPVCRSRFSGGLCNCNWRSLAYRWILI